MLAKPTHRRARLAPLALTLLALQTLLAAGSTGVPAPAASPLLPAGALAPTPQQRLLAPRIARILEDNHYRHVPIDERMSPEIFERYLGSIDGQHSYFTAADIANFEHWQGKFGDIIHSGDLDPAFLIFDVFLQRNRERVNFAIEQLDVEPDWHSSENFVFDREHAPWPASSAELDTLWRQRVRNDEITLILTGKTWSEATAILRKRYERVLARLDKIKSEDVFEALMNAYCAAYDPHSNYFSPRSSEEYRIQMSLSYVGIGASLHLSNDDYVTITNILPGGPAQADGTLKANDRITAVGQGHDGPLVDVVGWWIDDVVQLIRGKAGTAVRLQILPAGAAPGTAEHTLTLVRNKVTLEAQAPKKELRLVKRGDRTYRVGVITVPNFYNDNEGSGAFGGGAGNRSTTHDVRRLLQEFASDGGIDALVMDLRGDGGGYLPETIGLSHLFIDHGPVVQVKSRDGMIDVLDDPDPGVVYGGPLAVLVDRTSASASEIFAAAIQDYHRGLIIGQTTFGKGTVQSVIPLDRWSQHPTEGQVTVTIGKFYRVTGESTQLRGVTPDIELPSALSLDEIGETALKQALPWDRIATVPFNVMPPDQSIATLVGDEAGRSAHNADYQWLMANLKSIEQARREKLVSLDLKQRQHERTAQEEARLAQENARRTASGLLPIKSLEEITPTDEPDVLLQQSAEIIADDVILHQPTTAAGAPAAR